MQDVRSQPDADRLVTHYLAPFFLFGGLLLILYLTLMPFQFYLRGMTLAEYADFYELFPSSLFDFPRNVLLFMPFGFGLTAVLDERGWSRKRTAFAVLLAGLLLTLTVESLQQYIPDRQPSVSDLVSNTLGALAGLGTYRLWQNRVAAGQKLGELLLMPHYVLTGVVTYTMLLLLVAHGLAVGVRFSDWEPDYNLLLGNEQTGNRPWQGMVRNLAFFSEALAADEVQILLEGSEATVLARDTLLAYYPLAEGVIQADLTGQQPELIWRYAGSIVGRSQAWPLEAERWLESRSPVTRLSADLEATSQMTVALEVTTADLRQYGPARIVTISEDPHLRNLTIGQDGPDLVLRVRSHLTGDNGTSPEYRFPDLFAIATNQVLLIVYDGLSVSVFSSGADAAMTIDLLPGVAFVGEIDPQIGPYWVVQADETLNWVFHLLFYGLFLLPFALLLSLPALRQWSRFSLIALLATTLLLVPLLLEWVMVAPSDGNLRPLNIGVSMAVVVGIGWIVMPLVRRSAGFWRDQ